MVLKNKKNQLQNMINNNPWFARYYDFKELDIIGLRDNFQREKIYSEFNFKGKKILDIGCNLGKNFMYLSDKNPARLIGVDLEETIKISKQLSEFLGKNNIEYYSIDLNNSKWFKELKRKSQVQKFDFTIFVSVYGTKELYNRDNILNIALSHTKELMFFEGHHLENHKKYAKIFLNNNRVKNYEFRGYLRDKNNDLTSEIRPFYTIFQKDFSLEYIIDKIQKIRESKGRVIVGIEGLAGAGKTTFFRKIQKQLSQNSRSIFIDDLIGTDKQRYSPTNTKFKILKYTCINFIKERMKCNIRTKSLNHCIYDKTYETIVISDYRLRKYINTVDVLIHVQTGESIRKKRILKRDGKKTKYPNTKITSKNFSTDYFYTLKK